MNYDTLGWTLAGGGWLIVVGLSIACFRASRDDGDHTGAGHFARAVAFLAGGVFALLATLPLVEAAQHWWQG